MKCLVKTCKNTSLLMTVELCYPCSQLVEKGVGNDFKPDWDTVEPYLDYISQLQEKLQGLSKIKELADYRLKLLTKMPSDWVSLTDAEIDNLELPEKPTVKQFIRFIETKLKEKNND